MTKVMGLQTTRPKCNVLHTERDITSSRSRKDSVPPEASKTNPNTSLRAWLQVCRCYCLGMLWQVAAMVPSEHAG